MTVLLLNKYHLGIKKVDWGELCSTNVRNYKCSENLRESDHLRDVERDGRNIPKWILNK